ncbi:hypothetical protein BU26DRAFT_524903 [Trematosphaeria pertusa]|uniref:Uncharacterized protein n=1 Tax=Trematosphaeria pertusa TaxID=390896 RepID=A0A6A6HUG6_9PLEO|nr:uncharacterized protein BU26DRAFT_524903 [Trematosphaeria pertusa]KAF2241746.1 hypothetical protein BU26DRAFT_524903 [Trematosphaeria pertusa]
MGIIKKSDSQKYRGRPVNWNQEIGEAINPDLVSWRTKMKKQTASIAALLDTAIKSACDEVSTFISQSSLPVPLKAVALEEWKQRQAKVLEKSACLDMVLREALRKIYKYASTETDIRCMISRVNAAKYEKIQKMPVIESWFHKQKAAMEEAMLPKNSEEEDMLDRISDHLHKEAKRQLELAFSTFLAGLVDELQTFDDHMGERLPPEYQLTDSDLKIRDGLKALLPELEQQVADLSKLLTESQGKRDRDEVEVVEESETPTKRLRFTFAV